MINTSHLVDRQLAWSGLNTSPIIRDARRGLVDWSGQARRVLIYGAGFGRQVAPLDDPSWSVWAINLIPPLDRAGRIRASVWFDLHQKCAQSSDDLRWIAQCPVPIYVPDDLVDVGPNCVRYPIERILDEVADGPFACSFAYMIALALLEGFREIGLYGVELAYGTTRERTVEYASVNWWMGFAEAKGVTFHRPARSRMGTHRYLYGLEYEEERRDVTDYLTRVAVGDAHAARQRHARVSVGG